MNKELVVSMAVGWFLMLVYAAFMLKAGLDERAKNGGFISFGSALVPMLITYLIATFIATVFNYVLFNFIDASLVDLQLEVAIEGVEKMRGFLGDEGADAAIAAIEEKGISTGPLQYLLNWLGSLLIPGLLFLIYGLIVAAIIKKNNPEQERFV
ncbi:MAG TPA: hypothetical protein DCQ58_08145 [Saprospirales bacterium]|nr:hypothetical protein [Saprospirales bacterium]